MRRKRLLILIIGLGIIVLGAAGYTFREPLGSSVRSLYAANIAPRLPGAAGEVETAPQPLTASGTVEAHTVSVGSAQGGRLAAVRVNEGDVVAPGAVIAEIDTSVSNAELAQAQAGVALAKAQLALL